MLSRILHGNRILQPVITALWAINGGGKKKTYVGLDASAWSVCSFSPPSTSIVQYTMRLGAKDLRPCTSMITTWKQSHKVGVIAKDHGQNHP